MGHDGAALGGGFHNEQDFIIIIIIIFIFSLGLDLGH
jgi:hypothetical protein